MDKQSDLQLMHFESVDGRIVNQLLVDLWNLFLLYKSSWMQFSVVVTIRCKYAFCNIFLFKKIAVNMLWCLQITQSGNKFKEVWCNMLLNLLQLKIIIIIRMNALLVIAVGFTWAATRNCIIKLHKLSIMSSEFSLSLSNYLFLSYLMSALQI